MAISSRTPSLVDRLDQAIHTSPHLIGREVRLETNLGTVVLRGTVNTYFQKQMAQEALRRVDGVQQIDNQLEVDWV